MRAVPDEELAEEVVRLETAVDGRERIGKLGRSGSGSMGIDPGADDDGPAIEEGELGEIEAVDVEDVWEEGKRHSPMGLLVVSGLLGLLVLGVALLKIPKGDRLVEQRASEQAAKLDEEAQSLADAGVLMERIEGAVKKYFGAETVEEKLKYVRHRQRVKPLMEGYYREHELKPRSYGSVTALYPVGVENDAFIFLQVRDGDGEVLPLLLEQVGNQEVMIDWETDVAYQPMPLDEFLEERPAEGVDFRVFVKLDSFYAYEFDESRYQSVLITERDSDTYLFGYLERESETYREVVDLLGGNPKRTEPMLLKLRILPGSQSKRSVLVQEVVAKRWALVMERDDGK